MKRPWVIKAGGELLASNSSLKKILKDLAKLHRKTPIVFVHGGGPQIEEALKKAHIAIQFKGGRRVTSEAAMTVVERILSGQVNKSIAARLVAQGVSAVGLSCRDGGTITGAPISGLGRAALPIRIRTNLLKVLLKARQLPLLSSVGSDKRGSAVNINADDAASAIAQALKASHLVFLTNISGVMDQHKKRIPVLPVKRIPKLIKDEVITKGMIPKVQSAAHALKKGVGEVDIVNGSAGIRLSSGTRIVK